MGIGYGSSMYNTDEVLWAAGADASSSTVYDTYSTSDTRPTEDTTNLYTTATPVLTNGFIVFTSTRPLTPPASDTNSFTITLGTSNDMIWAYNDYNSADGYTTGVVYHGDNKSVPGWQMTVNSDGTVTSSGNIEPATPTVTTSLILTLENGSTLEAGYSEDTVTYVASVLPSNWMGIGYGNSMIDTDEVIWAAGADVSTSTVYDTYSTADTRPT
jgi:hypothetical protein